MASTSGGVRVGHRVTRGWRRPGRRRLIQAAADAAAWAAALGLAVALGSELEPVRADVDGLVAMIPIAAAAQVAAGLGAGLYLGRWRFGSFDEVPGLVRSVVAATAGLLVAHVALPGLPHPPPSVPVGAGLAALVIMAGVRYGWRMVGE
ncbi:MAG TPA: hypothetical protein VG455_17225, partial [Acidimicrobiales bacterium]|nr:hypothetical protein [Acidimicrobiales bacterium]